MRSPECRTIFPDSSRYSSLSSLHSILCRLLKSLASLFHASTVCFQSFAASFVETPGVAYPHRVSVGLEQCTLSQKHLFLTPVFATLTHSCSCKSFACHSYENTGMASQIPSPLPHRRQLPPFFSPTNASTLAATGSRLRNTSLGVRLTRVRAFASVKERSASPLQHGGPAE
jgi:hypothetical protein